LIFFFYYKIKNFFFIKIKIQENLIELIIFFISFFFCYLFIIPILNFLFFFKEEERESINIISSQWFWSIEKDNFFIFNNLELDFSILNFYYNFIFNKIITNFFNLDFINMCNNIFFLSLDNYINFYISSNDVEHSFFLPNINIKIDSHPGKISIINLYFNVLGNIKAVCAELCGQGHSFIPFCFEITLIN